MVLTPSRMRHAELIVTNGPRVHRHKVSPGRVSAITIPFVPGQVSLELLRDKRLAWKGEGRAIDERIERYNFNMWTGSWNISLA
jgi:glucan endo-1,3-alpha-glucosidase